MKSNSLQQTKLLQRLIKKVSLSQNPFDRFADQTRRRQFTLPTIWLLWPMNLKVLKHTTLETRGLAWSRSVGWKVKCIDVGRSRAWIKYLCIIFLCCFLSCLWTLRVWMDGFRYGNLEDGALEFVWDKKLTLMSTMLVFYCLNILKCIKSYLIYGILVSRCT